MADLSGLGEKKLELVDLPKVIAAAKQEAIDEVIAKSKSHEFWETATREELLVALKFQGAMTATLLEEQSRAWGRDEA